MGAALTYEAPVSIGFKLFACVFFRLLFQEHMAKSEAGIGGAAAAAEVVDEEM